MHRWKSTAQALDLCTACKTSAHRTCVSTKKHIVHFYDYSLMYISCVIYTDTLYSHVCMYDLCTCSIEYPSIRVLYLEYAQYCVL